MNREFPITNADKIVKISFRHSTFGICAFIRDSGIRIVALNHSIRRSEFGFLRACPIFTAS
jgi:hypothetical protein